MELTSPNQKNSIRKHVHNDFKTDLNKGMIKYFSIDFHAVCPPETFSQDTTDKTNI